MPERELRPYVYKPSRLRPRQAPPRPPGVPELPSGGDEASSDESSLDGESDSEGEDDSSDDEEGPNPFASNKVTGTAPRTTISSTTAMSDNPFASAAAVTASSFSATTTTTVTTSLTSQNLVQGTATGAAAESSAPIASSSGGQPKHTTAIALGSVLGVLSVAVAAYLLFRFCTPIRNRVARYRGRKGSKLPGEEDGVVPRQLGGGMVQSGGYAARNPFRYSKAASPIATPAPSYTRDVAIAVPITSTRAPAPISIHPASRDDDPENPFSDDARTLSRNNTNKSTRSQQPSVQRSGTNNSRPATDIPGEQSTYAFNFSFDDYRNSGTDLRRSALTNNPTFATSGPGATSNSRSNSVKRSLAIDVNNASQTPNPASFAIPYAPPSDVATPRTQYIPRQRHSITPSESVSNAPYSPLPFPAGLMPATRAMDSRWSRNTSSVWARDADDKGANMPESPPRAATRPPPLPLSVRTSTASLSSQSSSTSKRSSSNTSLAPGQDPVEKQSTIQPASAQQLKTVSAIVGLPTSVRPVSHTSSGVTLKPTTYRP